MSVTCSSPTLNAATEGSGVRDGPTSTGDYAGTALEGLVSLSSGIQTFAIEETGTYRIEAYGSAAPVSSPPPPVTPPSRACRS